MLSEKYRKYIDACFKNLRDHPDELLLKSALYCGAQWICCHHKSTEVTIDDVNRLITTSEPVRQMLHLLGSIDRPVTYHADVLYGLCYLIHRANLTGSRAKLYYQYYLTCVVADSSLFTDSTLPSFENGPLSCTIIHLALLYGEGKEGTGAVFEDFAPKVYARWKHVIFDILNVEYDEFERYWSAVHWLEATYAPRKRGKIEKAIRAYRKQHVPLVCLLEHYSQLTQYDPEVLRGVTNQWDHVNRNRKDFVLERGLTVEEKLFNDAAYQISLEQPADVIQTVFYNGRDDGKIECALVRSEVRRLMSITKQCFVVNPSPAFLKEIQMMYESTDGEHPEITMAVNDELVAGLYEQQFDDFQFITIDDIPQLHTKFDHIIILARDHETAPLWSALSHSEEGAHITMLIPQSVMTTRDALFAHHMRENQIYPDWILEIPQSLTGSEPRKKMLITGRKGRAYTGRYINLHSTVTDDGANYLTLSKNQITVPPDWIYRGLTLAQMRKEARESENKPAKNKQESQVYDFSAEIKISYYIIRKDGQVERARAYYRNIHRPEKEKHRAKGKRPNDVKTERGIRGTTEEEIHSKLEKVALYDEYFDHIVADILDYYSEDYRVLTVKSLWYICRKELLSRISYDESIALRMFCEGDQSLSDLVCGASSPEDFAAAMEAVYGAEDAGKKEWLQLYLIYQVAVEEGLLEQNPLVSIMRVVKEHDRERMYMLNSALRRSHFADAEERRMVEFLCEHMPVNGRKGGTAPRYVIESKWLAGVFSLFAGIPIREICPLLWRDLSHIDDLEEMQIAITKHLNANGDVISNVNYGNKEHFRRIAVDVVLGRMLMERKQYLIERLGYTEESLADLPIMLDAEPSGRGRRKYTRLSRETARKVNRQLLTAAQIPEDIISLLEGEDRMKIDLNAERNDLFASNFRHKAYHICGFTNGELSHHLGNKGVDVYTNHYCDFGNDMLQYAMVCKLYRWTHVYDTKCQTKGIHTLSETINCGRVYTTGCYRDGLAHTELSLEPEQGSEEIIQLEIECEHGLEGAVLTIGKGGEQP